MKKTILVWNDDVIRIVRMDDTDDEIEAHCGDLRNEMHEDDDDTDLQWQILPGWPRVDSYERKP